MSGYRKVEAPKRTTTLPARATSGGAVPSRLWPAMLGGVRVNSFNEFFTEGRKQGIDVDTLKQMLGAELQRQAMAPTPSQYTTSPQRFPACLFTICMQGGALARGLGAPDKMLKMRLHIDDGDAINGNIIRNIHQFVTSEKVISVCFKPNGEFVTLEDETALYPSDKLVAAFLLLLKE